MRRECTKEDYSHIELLVTHFCSIILTKKDELDFERVKQFIDRLSDNDKSVLNLEEPENDSSIRLMIQMQITKYLDSYGNFVASNSVMRPFEFDSGGKYNTFCENCKEYYKQQNVNAKLPPVIDFTLKYIQEMSEHYRIFGYFYEVRSKETAYSILNDIAQVAEDKAKIAVKSATKESARNAVNVAVDKKMNEITKNVSETSVTILGIFASIVLTVVAGLIYSSSVLNNINSANFCRLISVSALIGFVCYSLLALMFRYIERIKYKNDDMPGFNKLSIIVGSVLLLIMIVFGVLQYYDFNQKTESQNSNINITTEQSTFINESSNN